MNNKKRLYIELDQENNSSVQTYDRLGALIANLYDDKTSFFNTVIHDAGSDSISAFNAIIEHDEIYASTALIPKPFGINGGDFFNALMYQAIKNNIAGKSVYLFREYGQIKWYNLRSNLVDKCFRNNYLYVLEENEAGDKVWIQVDIDKLLIEISE